MLAIETEGEAEEIGLLGVAAEAVVGKIAEIVGLQIQDGEGLLFLGGVGAVAAVEEDGELAVGRERGGGGKVVGGAGLAGDIAEDFSVGDLHW